MLNGWDTHAENFPKTKELAGRVDQPLAYLLTDLKQRGLLDTTLVVWMGEFGRTPRIDPRAGRDHYPRAFNVLVAGGGTRGGQVIGRTDRRQRSGGSPGDGAGPVSIVLQEPENRSHDREHRAERAPDQDRRRRASCRRAVWLAFFGSSLMPAVVTAALFC